jgi:hypothetical protein
MPIFQLLHASTAQFCLDDYIGDETLGIGWWSTILESREASWWIGTLSHSKLPLVMVTLIRTADDSSFRELTVQKMDSIVSIKWKHRSENYIYSIDLFK